MMKQHKSLSGEDIDSIRKILIIQYKPFGDILLNTGYFAALRQRFPEAQIDFLIQRPYLTILEDNPHLDNLVIMEKKKGCGYYLERARIIKEVRKRGYDLVIDQLRGPGSAEITLLSGARFRLGWRLKRWNWVYNYTTKRENIRYYSRLKFDVLRPLGITEIPHNTFYAIRHESKEYIDRWLLEQNLEQSRLVVVSPGTPVPRKQWSLDYYADLIDLIQARTEFRVILLWGPGEEGDVERVTQNMKTEPIVALPTTFNQAGALLRRSEMFIGNDGGINHLAVALETPSIAIFGPTSNPKKWSAWHKDIHFYLRDWEFKTRGEHTFNITPEQAFEMFMKFFKLDSEIAR
jgi:ADP-heptose:LPS heptosyltransferase